MSGLHKFRGTALLYSRILCKLYYSYIREFLDPFANYTYAFVRKKK